MIPSLAGMLWVVVAAGVQFRGERDDGDFSFKFDSRWPLGEHDIPDGLGCQSKAELHLLPEGSELGGLHETGYLMRQNYLIWVNNISIGIIIEYNNERCIGLILSHSGIIR
jgi:hypothetical protein